MLPAWKRDSETSWLAQADSMALQQSVRDLDRAYKNFFRRVREGGKPGFPKFKSRRHSRQSYRTNGGKVVDRNHIALPKLGTVRAKVSRPLQGRFMSVTVSLDAAGRYFATSRNMSASLRGSSVGSPAGKVHAVARNRAAGI